jgi:hypothetical protein
MTNCVLAGDRHKRTLDISMSRHRKDMQNKLKTMRTKNPKEFWKILNKGKRKEQLPINHISGIIPVSNITLNNFSYMLINWVAVALIYSFVI